MTRNVLILGAAGRDFHNYLTYYKNNPSFHVKCFTATQIPGIENKTFPSVLAGKKYPHGIPILSENRLEQWIQKFRIDECAFSYSDVSHEYVMHLASRVQAAGASFVLLGPNETQLKSKKPVISVCAVRTGSGKSQTTRAIAEYFLSCGKRIVVIRHPMPYGNLAKQAVQRFSKYADFEKNGCTIEEREEYEKYVEKGIIVYAGVDYAAILKKAEQEADIILWDGGNNDFSFYKPDFSIVVADPHRSGHELQYYPGETNFRSADLILINKCDSATEAQIRTIEQNAKQTNPRAKILRAKSELSVENASLAKGKKALVIEDGPTTTHGGMAFGAGFLMARKLGCTIVSPRLFAVGTIQKTFEKFPHLQKILPAMGYNAKQLHELEQTIDRVPCEVVISGTPIDLKKLIAVPKPVFSVRYELDRKTQQKIFSLLKNKKMQRS